MAMLVSTWDPDYANALDVSTCRVFAKRHGVPLDELRFCSLPVSGPTAALGKTADRGSRVVTIGYANGVSYIEGAIRRATKVAAELVTELD